jgi:uncharacterized protein (DUF1697 family)
MSDRYIALLRGINVGKAKRIAMSDLRALVESLGYRDVRTLLNSGNIVFSSTAAKARNATGRIAEALTAELGVSARVTVLAAQEHNDIVDRNPFVNLMTDPSRMMVSVLATPEARAKLAPLVDASWGDERIALGERVAYVWCANGILESAVYKQVDRLLRDAVTTRNWATMLKVRDLVHDA